MKLLLIALLALSAMGQTRNSPISRTSAGAGNTFGSPIAVGACRWFSGTGSPEGVVTANVCDIFTRSNGSTSTTLYVKETGTGNIGWVAAGASGGTTTFTSLTDGATITWAIGSVSFANATVTLGGNRTLNITGPANGGSYILKIVQDGTGSRGLILGTGCAWKVSGGGGGAIIPTLLAASIDILAFTFDGTNCYANFAKNFN